MDSFAQQLCYVLKRFPSVPCTSFGLFPFLLAALPLSLSLCVLFVVFLLTVSLSLPLPRFLESKMQEMEARHREELEVLREEKSNLQALVVRQSGVILDLEAQLGKASGNSTVLQKQQQDLMNTVHSLLNLCSKDGGTVHKCCADQLRLSDFPKCPVKVHVKYLCTMSSAFLSTLVSFKCSL